MPRRFALYFAWSRPSELGVPLGQLENRYPTLFELRRALWPHFEHLRDAARFDQGIAGFLDHVILSDFEAARNVLREETGHEVEAIQREGDKPPSQQLDDDYLRDIDTLIVISLDHYRTRQEASEGEIQMLRQFLTNEGKCLIVCPHHDIGEEPSLQQIELAHHGDRLVPPQQRIGGFARSLLGGLNLNLENRFGLSPGRAADGSPAPIIVNSDLDTSGLLRGVETFNLHPHLPHLGFRSGAGAGFEVLAQQPTNTMAPDHPFVAAGNRKFNAFLQARTGQFGGRVLVFDATLWSSAFEGLESLKRLWRNIARIAPS